MSRLRFKIKNSALNFVNGCKLSLASLPLAATLFVASAMAHTPKPGQIAQHQARRLLTSKVPFRQIGTVTSAGKSFATELKWFGPASYDFTVSGLPSSYTGIAGNEGKWTLQRRAGNRCAVIAGNRYAQCGPAMFWAMIELSAQPESVAASLVRAGIYDSRDTVFDESHSNAVIDPDKRRVQLAIGKNGDTPKAVMRVRAPGAAPEAIDAAYIDFDQNFLVPLFAQFAYQGANYSIKAFTELGIDREQPRYSHVLATTLSVLKANEPIARFSRKELTPERALREDRYQEGAVSLASFQESLGGEASDLLTAILLTH